MIAVGLSVLFNAVEWNSKNSFLGMLGRERARPP